MKKVLGLILLSATILFAQEFSNWKLYTSMYKINDISSFKDFIWAATDGGIFSYNISNGEYNGYNKQQGLINHNINTLEIDKDGNVWFGDNKGVISKLNIENNNIESNLDISNSSKNNKTINNIGFKGDTVIVSTDFGIVLLNGNNLNIIDSFIKLGNFQSDEKVYSTIYLNKQFYAVTERGLAVSKVGKSNLVSPDNWLSYSSNLTMTDIKYFNDKILLSTNDGIYEFLNQDFVSDSYKGLTIDDLKVYENNLYLLIGEKVLKYNDNNFETILVSNNGNFTVYNNKFYLATNNGIYDSNDGNYIIPDGPEVNSFLDLSVSNDGALYIGTGVNTRGKGILSLVDNKWKTFNTANFPELKSNDYYKVSSGNSGSVYFSSWGYGFAILNKDKLTHYDSRNTSIAGIPADNNFLVVADVEEDLNGNIWILNYLPGDKKSLTVLTTDNQFISIEPNDASIKSKLLNARDMVIDQSNNIWFYTETKETGSIGKGLYRFNHNNTLDNFNDDKWEYLNSTNGLSSSDITSIALDSRGELWIATLNGLNYISDPSRSTPIISKVFGAGTILKNQNIRTLIADALNRKWVGTDEGIFIFNEDCSKLLYNLNSENSLLPDNTIYSITIDPNSGIAYVGSEFGLTSFSTNSVNPVVEFNELTVYPNPVKINIGVKKVFIDGLVRDAKIKIMSVSGNLINEFDSPGGRLASWDLKNFDGELVSSGIYIVVAYDEEGNNVAAGKIAVIR